MQKNFHYNLTFALAVKAGFSVECAQQIAWANQFTDDCKNYDKYGIRTMVDIGWKASDCFIPEVQKNVFVPFHFLPGSKDSLIVKGNSEIAQRLIQKAIDAKDRIALGIALHSFQDTYSHEGFCGVQSVDNAKYKWDKTGLSSLPPRIGHAEFVHDPDMVGKKWENQNGELIDNNVKFRIAAIETFRILKTFADGSSFDIINIKAVPLIDVFLGIRDYDKGKEFLFESMGLNPKNKTNRYSNFKPSQYHIESFVKYAKKQQSIVMEYMSQF